MDYWLLKADATRYSWDDLQRGGSTDWSWVRNVQALKNMKEMQVGDRAFFYHTYHTTPGKEIVGVVEVVKAYYVNSNGDGVVDVRPVRPLAKKVTRDEIIRDNALSDLMHQPQLTVVSVRAKQYSIICGMAGITR